MEDDPEYNYIEKVPSTLKPPKKLGIFDAMYFIEDNIARTTGILITGKEKCPKNKKERDLRIGEKSYFTSGVCGPKSTTECVGQPRNIIIDNMPGKVKNNEGLIPSMIGDMSAFEPIEIIKGIAGNGVHVNDRCSMKDVEIIQLQPNTKGKHYVRNEKLCVPDYKLNFQENFSNKTDINKTKICPLDIFVILFISILLLLILFKHISYRDAIFIIINVIVFLVIFLMLYKKTTDIIYNIKNN